MGTGEFNAGGNPAMDWYPIQRGVEIFLVASCHGNRDKLRPDGPLGSYADFTYLPFTIFFIIFMHKCINKCSCVCMIRFLRVTYFLSAQWSCKWIFFWYTYLCSAFFLITHPSLES